MHTKLLTATPDTISIGASLLQSGEIVAFPTETVYGLGANALDPVAVRKIFTAKNRPADNPLIVHIAELEMLETIACNIPSAAKELIERFWPGPLSLVLPKHDSVPRETTAGLDTVVVRFPSHPVAQALINAAGVPVAAPSANRSGHVSPTTAQHVQQDLDGRVPLILDDGAIEFGLESTVVDCTAEPALILRPGSITLEMLREVVPDIVSASTDPEVRSPGMKYRHYSPSAPVTLFVGTSQAVGLALESHIEKHKDEQVVIIAHSFDHPHVHRLPREASEAAPLLYETLRLADTQKPDRILIEGYAEEGVGTAIMNRLRKAAECVREV